MVLHKEMEFEGKDVAEAISKACKTLKVSQENLEIEVLKTGSSGIFGLCKQNARLRVSVKREEAPVSEGKIPQKTAKVKKSTKVKAAQKDREQPRKEKKGSKMPPEAAKVAEKEETAINPELLADVKDNLSRILELMHLPSEVSVSSEKENVTGRIKGEHVSEIVDQNGRILDSLQYLLRKIIGKKYSEKAIISIDAGDFRATRTEELAQLSLELAAEVKKNGKTKSIPSLNPSERRVVHLALQDDKEVRSRSVGEGIFKKVLIYRPGSKGKKGSARRRKGAKNKKS